MSQSTSRRTVYKLIDDLSDTKSWAELAKELDRCAGKARATERVSDNDTIAMADLQKSLGKSGGKQTP